MSRCVRLVILVCVVVCMDWDLRAEVPRGLREKILSAVEHGTLLKFGRVGGARTIGFVSDVESRFTEVQPMTFLVRDSLMRVLDAGVWEEVSLEEANALIATLVYFARLNDVTPQVRLSLWSGCDEKLLRQLLDHVAVQQMDEVLIMMPIEGCLLGGGRPIHIHKPIAPAKHKTWRWRR